MTAFDFPNELLRLSALFPSDSPLYAVGGQIRNPLLKLPVSDRDICSALTPDALMRLLEENKIAYVKQGLEYGTIAIHMGGESFEHTTFRFDSYGGGGAHRPESVCFSKDIKSDAFRRDFTVNALYVRIGDPGETVLDPTDRGLDDLRARVIRASSADPSVILRDDALRVLRMVRFASELGFTVESGSFEAAKQYANGLCDISKERVQGELNKILLSDLRYPLAAGINCEAENAGEDSPVYRGLAMLGALGAFRVVLPELAACAHIPQRAQYHAYDVMGHCLHACALIGRGAALPKEELLVLRLSALLHDIGKPEAKKRNESIPEAHGHMYGHDRIGAGLAREALLRLRYPSETIGAVCSLILRHMYDLTGSAKESTLRETFAQWGYTQSLRLVYMREADVYGSGRTALCEEVQTAARFKRILALMQAQGAPFSEKQLACTGEDIMRWTGLSPSSRIGELKLALLKHCARKPGDNRLERLERLCRDMAVSSPSFRERDAK